MPDVTVPFTDAQWTRIVAASSDIKRADESGDVDEAYLIAMFQALISRVVTKSEKRKLSVSDF
jgi:hypothetical protein